MWCGTVCRRNCVQLEQSGHGGKPCELGINLFWEEGFCSLRHGFQRWITLPHSRHIPLESVAHWKSDDHLQQ